MQLMSLEDDPSPYYLVNQILRNRKIAKNERMYTKMGKPPWEQHYYSDSKIYEAVLGLKPKSIEEIIRQSRSRAENFFVLDVGADTSMLASLNVSGVAIGLSDPRSYEKKDIDSSNNRFMIEGDVLYPSTWEKLYKSMEDLNIFEGFNLITVVPEGGIREITNNPEVHFEILQQLWSLLSSESGVLLIQTKQSMRDFSLESTQYIDESDWISFLNTIRGISATQLERGIQLIKSSSAPPFLPLNFCPLPTTRFNWKS